MSSNGAADPWLDARHLRAWLAYIRVQLRLSYEINRQLQTENRLSMPDYDVLNALSTVAGGRMQMTELADRIGWERSRAGHHVRRMAKRGLVDTCTSATDRRCTDVSLTGRGRDLLEKAAPGHVDLVRKLMFDGLPRELLGPLTAALEHIYAHLREHGAAPPT